MGRISGGAGLAMAVALPMLLLACDGGPTEPRGDGVDPGMAVLTMSMAQRPATLDGTDPYEASCPSGGRFVVEGPSAFGVEDGVAVTTWDQVMRFEDCAMSFQSSDAVANGQMHLVGEARFDASVDGDGQILMQESSQVGTMSTSYRGETTTCDYDLTHRYDPGADEYRITGTACGRTVDAHLPSRP